MDEIDIFLIKMKKESKIEDDFTRDSEKAVMPLFYLEDEDYQFNLVIYEKLRGKYRLYIRTNVDGELFDIIGIFSDNLLGDVNKIIQIINNVMSNINFNIEDLYNNTYFPIDLTKNESTELRS